MTRPDTKAILARADAATPGEWVSRDEGDYGEVWRIGEKRHRVCEIASSVTDDFTEQERADMAFIAAARTDVPALCLRVEALEAALRRTLDLAENWADGKGRSHPDHEICADARAALDGAE